LIRNDQVLRQCKAAFEINTKCIADIGDSDDLLDEAFTDQNGEFRVDGTTREMTTIEPILKIFHDCNDGIRQHKPVFLGTLAHGLSAVYSEQVRCLANTSLGDPCQKLVQFDVPEKYIHRGKVNEWFDIGELNMEMTFRNEGRECNV
uniref:Phosphoribosylformylglycinamidine synthase n=1 Tax=Anisakis simplex TaxID=6269 RepID=A0A0M3J187_ANISI